MFHYRPARTEDAPALQQLWEECFPQDKGAFANWYFATVFNPRYAYVAETAEKIVGSLHAPPIPLCFNGKAMPVPYIQGIATAVSHRNLGVAKNLIRYSLSALAEQGFAMAVLEPFLPLFYEKLGFRSFANSQSVGLSGINDPTRQHHANATVFGPLNTNPDTVHLNRIYQAFGNGFYSYPLRDSVRWQNLLYDHMADGGKLLASENAYLLYFQEGSTLKIRELAYTQETHAQHLLQKTKSLLHVGFFAYSEQPQAMYYTLQAEQQKGTPVLTFPPYHKQHNYFNELF